MLLFILHYAFIIEMGTFKTLLQAMKKGRKLPLTTAAPARPVVKSKKTGHGAARALKNHAAFIGGPAGCYHPHGRCGSKKISHGLGRPPKGNKRAWAALDPGHGFGRGRGARGKKCAKPLKTANDELNSMGAAACFATKHN